MQILVNPSNLHIMQYIENKKTPPPHCKLSLKTFCKKTGRNRGVSSVNDPAIIYDFEGGLYPADIMDLAVLLNSD